METTDTRQRFERPAIYLPGVINPTSAVTGNVGGVASTTWLAGSRRLGAWLNVCRFVT